MKKIKLYVSIPTTGTIVDSSETTRRRLEKKYGDKIEFVYPDMCVRRIFHDFARNCHVEDFLATDCDAMWFLDSDITPPEDVLDIVTKHWDEWQVAGAPYPVFQTPREGDYMQVVFAVYQKNPDTGGLHAAPVPSEGGTAWVDGLATGCMFIKRDVFSKLEKPYFEFKYRKEDRYMIEGEDLGFCLKLSKLGIKFFIDYSKVCKHEKKVCLADVNNYAVIYARDAVTAYERIIKDQVSEALAAARQKGRAEGYQAALSAPRASSIQWGTKI